MKKFFAIIFAAAMVFLMSLIGYAQEAIKVVQRTGDIAMEINNSSLPLLEKENQLTELVLDFFSLEMADKMTTSKSVDAEKKDEFRKVFWEYLK